jgi:hypothetical protein
MTNGSDATDRAARMRPQILDIVLAYGVYFASLVTFFFFEEIVFGDALTSNATAPNWMLVLEELADVVILCSVLFYYCRIKNRLSWESMGWVLSSFWQNIVFGLVVGAFVWFAVIPLDLLVKTFFGEGPFKHPTLERFDTASTIGEYALLLISGCLLTPITEEWFLRGFAYTLLTRHYTRLTSVLFCNLLFFVSHFNPWWFLQIFTIGIALTLLYDYSKSLISPIAAHSIINLLTISNVKFHFFPNV